LQVLAFEIDLRANLQIEAFISEDGRAMDVRFDALCSLLDVGECDGHGFL
jgi:hypothetical protein